MKKKAKQSKKPKINKNIIIYSSIALIILISIIVVFSIKSSPKELTLEDIDYTGYVIDNEDYLKEKCAFIRVGRCDKIGLEGEEFGECWFRDVKLQYDLKGISPRTMSCEATLDDGTTLGLSTFSDTDDWDIKELTYEVDIRQINDITVCCGDTCLPSIGVEAIC